MMDYFIILLCITLFLYAYFEFLKIRKIQKTYQDCIQSITATTKILSQIADTQQKTIERIIKDITDLQIISGEMSSLLMEEFGSNEKINFSFSEKKPKNKPN